MIIILGPDNSGKTTLAKKLDLPYYHFDYNSVYNDYLPPLCTLECTNAVWDRHIICEYAYAKVMGRRFAFNMKEWHNIILLTLIHNPLIILSTHKPQQRNYPADQYMPYEKWNNCLSLYRYFLNSHQIPYTEYDYAGPITVEAIKIMHEKHIKSMAWWRQMWKDGVGCIGSSHPHTLLVAERLGPNNVNNLPFETGPTGKMFTDMLVQTKFPLGRFTVTNLVKSFRRDTRNPNDNDLMLLTNEVHFLKPKKIVFMGSVAKLGIQVARLMDIKHVEMVHFGYYSHRGVSDMSKVYEEWKNILEIKEAHNV